MRTFKEVPYESDVTLKSWVPLSNGELSLVFQVEVRNKNHRAMILGRDSINIKEITANTIRDISEMIQRPVKVEILVVLTKIKNIHKSNNRQALEF
jgi:GTPase Era involved in 16S rRNA processing